MHFPLRLYGIENEFGVVAQMPNGTFTDILDKKISDLIHVRPRENSILAQESITGADRVWHTNGSCTYVDIGDHPEHATPEVASVRDAVKYNKAGEILVSHVFGPPHINGVRFLLFKNNLGYDIHADEPTISGQFGCHENYLLHTNSFHTSITPPAIHEYDLRLKPLIPFLATRQLFDGSGWWERDMTYHLSQRASAIQTEIGGGAVSIRSFFQIKTGDTGSDRRLHIISGDANMCEFALYLKLGTTSLVLALLESGRCPIFKYTDAVAALKEISRYADTCMYSFQRQDGSHVSSLDVQRIFFESVRAQLPSATYTNDEVEAEVGRIMLYWEQTLNALYHHDDEWMRGKIDYITKRYMAETYIRKQNIIDQSALSLAYKTIDIMYHCISNPALQQRMKAKWHHCRILNDDEINHAVFHAPQNTRARMRGLFVQTLLNKKTNVAAYINWNRLHITHRGKFYSLNLPHGLIANLDEDEFEKFLLLVE